MKTVSSCCVGIIGNPRERQVGTNTGKVHKYFGKALHRHYTDVFFYDNMCTFKMIYVSFLAFFLALADIGILFSLILNPPNTWKQYFVYSIHVFFHIPTSKHLNAPKSEHPLYNSGCSVTVNAQCHCVCTVSLQGTLVKGELHWHFQSALGNVHLYIVTFSVRDWPQSTSCFTFNWRSEPWGEDHISAGEGEWLPGVLQGMWRFNDYVCVVVLCLVYNFTEVFDDALFFYSLLLLISLFSWDVYCFPAKKGKCNNLTNVLSCLQS